MKKKSKRNNLTTISPIPDEIIKYSRCAFLHTKTPIMVGIKIIYVCLECAKEKEKENG
jgi:hypothetical protein